MFYKLPKRVRRTVKEYRTVTLLDDNDKPLYDDSGIELLGNKVVDVTYECWFWFWWRIKRCKEIKVE